jgi:hypothetical protein
MESESTFAISITKNLQHKKTKTLVSIDITSVFEEYVFRNNIRLSGFFLGFSFSILAITYPNNYNANKIHKV